MQNAFKIFDINMQLLNSKLKFEIHIYIDKCFITDAFKDLMK